ncbi:MAG: type ISP restriction/modification enzyme, partial [Dongiaceae bacterium]
MRERYLDVFDRIWIDCLNGDKYKTGKLTPEGEPDPSIFSTEHNREGIQVGTAIALLVRAERHQPAADVRFRQLWGRTKPQQLLDSAEQDGVSLYAGIKPPLDLGLPFQPIRATADYLAWPKLPDLFPASFPGVKTSRDEFVVDIDRERLERRLEQYFDSRVGDDEVRSASPVVMNNTARFDAAGTRRRLVERGLLRENILRYCYRPFDVRWLYWEPETKLLDEKRVDYFRQVFDGNSWLSAGQRNRKDIFYQPQFTTRLADHHIVESNVGMFPLHVRTFTNQGHIEPNLSSAAARFLTALKSPHTNLFHHTLAVLQSSAYRDDNLGALRQDWPRVPLPAAREGLEESAALGRQVAALLDTEAPVESVTAGTVRPELRGIGAASRVGGGALKPREFRLTAGWGHAGKGGVTMPGKGKVVERNYTTEERAAIAAGAAALGLGEAEAFACLGENTCDVYLNDTAYWGNVPARAWAYTIGGYQVMK